MQACWLDPCAAQVCCTQLCKQAGAVDAPPRKWRPECAPAAPALRRRASRALLASTSRLSRPSSFSRSSWMRCNTIKRKTRTAPYVQPTEHRGGSAPFCLLRSLRPGSRHHRAKHCTDPCKQALWAALVAHPTQTTTSPCRPHLVDILLTASRQLQLRRQHLSAAPRCAVQPTPQALQVVPALRQQLGQLLLARPLQRRADALRHKLAGHLLCLVEPAGQTAQNNTRDVIHTPTSRQSSTVHRALAGWPPLQYTFNDGPQHQPLVDNRSTHLSGKLLLLGSPPAEAVSASSSTAACRRLS